MSKSYAILERCIGYTRFFILLMINGSLTDYPGMSVI